MAKTVSTISSRPFDRYAAIRDVSRKLDDTEKALKAWSAAKNYKVIPAIRKKAYEDNQNRIATLEGELADVRLHLAQYTSNVSEVVNLDLDDRKVLYIKDWRNKKSPE